MSEPTPDSHQPPEVIPAKRSSLSHDRAVRSLMECYVARLPKDHQIASVRIPVQELWVKLARYTSREQLMSIGEALVFAADAHREQKRHSGEPYVVHTISVASILADIEADHETIEAALLHDVLEDTPVADDTLRERFGENVLRLVDGVTKLGKLPFKSVEEYQAENLRKMLMVMAEDIRVILIKLADRMHNMRTIQAHRPEKQMSIARETLDIYAPMAHRLGIYHVKRELEDLSFKVLDPEMYYEIRRRVRKKLPEREAIIKQAMETLEHKLAYDKVKATIKGRPKHFYSIYEKMHRKNLTLDQLYDLLALRVLVDTIGECYQVLGIVHTIWKPIPGQFDDYVANPKSNMYRSLHTTVLGPSGEPLEVQIRTWEMNSLAEYGIASHWNYKEGGQKVSAMDEGLGWIRQALESQQEGADSPDAKEFMDRLKTDVLSTEVLVYTPKGEVVAVPVGSTPIDFAYTIHTQVGHRCVGAMVNGRIVPLDHELKNGDIVRILTSPQGKPSRDWLKIAKSNRTRTKIRAFFRQIDRADRDEKFARGKELMEKELARRNPENPPHLDSVMPAINHMAHDMGYKSGEEVVLAVGSGNQTASGIIARIDNKPKTEHHAPPPVPVREIDSEIVVDGAAGVLVVLAQCCRPVPGDPIAGAVTTNRGITIHRSDCVNLPGKDSDRRVVAAWGRPKQSRYMARILVEGINKPSFFSDVTSAISSTDGGVASMKANVVNSSRSRMTIEVQVHDVEHLYRIMGKLNILSGVLGVVRG